MLEACFDKIQPSYLCQLHFGREPEGLIHCCCLLIRVSSLCGRRQGTATISHV